MNRILGYMLVGMLVLLVGCGGGQEAEKVMGPEQTLETFCRAVAAGDMEMAEGLCDAEAMKEYLDGWERTWQDLEKKDSCALKIAAGMLSEAEFTVMKVEKKGDERFITYTLASGGKDKTRQAVVTKEEGEWRVKGMTDVQ